MRLTATLGVISGGLVLGVVGIVGVVGTPGAGAAEPAPPGEVIGHASTACVGTGEDGPRVQLVAVTEEGDGTYGDALLARIREQAAQTDDLLAGSTEHPGTARRVRWATDADCTPTVLHRTIPAHDYFGDPGSLDAAVDGLGLTWSDRRYVLLFPWSSLPDTEGGCSRAPVPADTQPGPANASNTTNPGPVRVVVSCYDDGPAVPPRLAHALVHSLGAVHPDAPHATSDGHCTTAGDLMCVPQGDGPRADGADGAADGCVLPRAHLLDCDHDDYYATQPPPAGSYLATHWNVADSVFLTAGPSLAPNTLTGLTIEGPAKLTAGTPATLTAQVTDSVDAPGSLRYHWDVANNGRCQVVGPDDSRSIRVICEEASVLRMSVGVDRPDQYGLRTGRLTSAQAAATGPTISSLGTAQGGPASVPAGLPLELRVASDVGPGGTHRWTAPEGCTLTPSGDRQQLARLLCGVATAGTTRSVEVTALDADGRTSSASLPVTLTAAAGFSPLDVARGPWGTVALAGTLRLPGGGPVHGLPVTWWGTRQGGSPVELSRVTTAADGSVRLLLRRRSLTQVWVAAEAPGLVSPRADLSRSRPAARR